MVCPPGSALSTVLDPDRVAIKTLPVGGDHDAVFGYRLARWLAEEQPDLLHVHSRRGADIWGGLAARHSGVPAVLTRRVDNPEPMVLGGLKYRMYERVIAISEEIRARLHTSGVPNSLIHLVHSAIDPAACQPIWSRAQFQAAFGLADIELVVVCVAQLIPRKGQRVLLEAWQAVLEGCPRARLILFGRGPDEDELRELARRKGIADSVQFAGFRADLLTYLGRADVLVHPALQEGLGVCLLEAQAAGLPVVASRAGGIPEAVADGVTGVLTQPGDAAELAAALVGVLLDAPRREALGVAGREYVAEHFSPSAMVSGNLAVYNDLSQGAGR